MSVQQQIAKLESLLDRIRRKAQEPRIRHVAVAAQAAAPKPTRERAPVEVEAASELIIVESPPPPAGAAVASPPAEQTSRYDAPLTSETRVVVPSSVPGVSDEALLEQLDEVEVLEEEEFEELAAAGAAGTEVDIDFEDEEAPESAPRPAASSIGQALDEAADAVYGEEPPIKTPPPESGRQPLTSPPIPPAPEITEAEISGSGDVDTLLEADLSGGPISLAAGPGPTMEQVGETVELEASGSERPVELEVGPPISGEKARLPDELEATIPGNVFAGAYDPSLSAPPSARAELERRREAEEPARRAEASAPAPVSAPPTDTVRVDVTERPPVPAIAQPVEFVAGDAARKGESFLALLDETLSLGR